MTMHATRRTFITILGLMLAISIIPVSYPPSVTGFDPPPRANASELVVDADGGGEYLTIQTAIDNASAGDIIRVHEGTYRENVVIHIPLTLTGSGSGVTVIDGGSNGHVVRITADNVSIRGFTVMNSGMLGKNSGVVVEGGNTQVENCSFEKSRNSILLHNSHGNLIANNTCNSVNGDGMRLHNSSDNRIINNVVTARNYTRIEKKSVLYEAALGGTPADQEFMYMAYPFSSSATQTYENNMTVLDTTSVKNDKAGYFNDPDSMPEFNMTRGFSASFTLRIMNETHAGTDRDGDGIDDRAGFNIIVISSELVGVELAFWENEIWVQEEGDDMPPNGDLFTHAEGVFFDTTAGMVNYSLAFRYDNYTLAADNSPILTGRVRDYTAFSGLMDPYETANLFFIGDDTSSASARAGLSHASITVNVTVPNPDPDPNYDHGLYLHSSDNNIIRNNTCANNSGTGIYLSDSSNNIFHLNVLHNNTGAGLRISDTDSDENIVYHNTFTDNNAAGIQGSDNGEDNVWDDGAQGNYWSDHGSRYPGSVSDGTIWNTPYGMEGTAGSADRYPLVRPGEPEFTDATPPTITADNSFISGTTGDPYEFNISAWDDTGVLSVKVNYSHGLLKGNLTLAGNNDHWSGSITLDDSVDDLNYSIYINDTVGNLCSSEPKFIVVTDNDPPAFIDHSRNNGTTGDIFEFNISALDNIGVETVQVNWSHGGRVDNLTLKEIGGRWYGKIGITNNTSDLTYWVNVTDNSGNLFISTPYNISVLDNDAPVAAAGPDQVAYLYEKIVISGENSSDNIGIVNFTWSLVTPEGPLYLHGPKLDISFNYFGFFPITLSVRDSAGNHGEDVINITVLPSGSCVDDDDDDDECDNTSVDDNGTDDDTPGDDEEPEDDDTDDDVGPGDPTRTGSGDENFFSSKEGIGIVIGAVLLVLLMMIFIQRRRDSRAKTDVIELEGEVEENFIDADMEIHEDEVERMNEDDTKDE